MTPRAPREEPARDARRLGRRQLLHGSAVALGGAGVGWGGAAAAHAVAPGPTPGAGRSEDRTTINVAPSPGGQSVAFHGPHQAGITTAAQAHLCLLGLDLVADVDLGSLGRMLRVLSDDAARLTSGEPALADTEPELAANPSRLTVTFGVGPRVYAALEVGPGAPAFGQLPAFSTDRLLDEWGQTDLAIQICGDDVTTVAHARRMLVKDARSFARVQWVQEGFRRARGSEASGTTMRNVMGQVDGTVNPGETDADFADLVWADDDSAFAGGTFMVVRRIRALMDTWDKVDRAGREFAVGRTLDTGAPLTGTAERDEPDFEAVDDAGFTVIDAASHIRRARSDDASQRFLRRGYNYAVLDSTGEEDSGLVFIAFAADLARQFVPIQQRLAEEDRLNEWVTTIGSAVYAVLPGAPDGGFVGTGLVGA